MKAIFIFSFFLITGYNICLGQQKPNWTKWDWLMGEWTGEGSGQPGQGGGTFTLKPDLDNTILVRKNHAVYPATTNKPEIIHDDLMIVYPDFSGNPSKAIYFDNEGHTIQYNITYPGSSIVFTSDKIPNMPVFRLTYTANENATIGIKFEMSRDGEKFMTYTEGVCKKKK